MVLPAVDVPGRGDPDEHASDRGDDEGDEGELERRCGGLRQIARDGIAGADRATQVEVQRAVDVLEPLHRHRIVEPELLRDLGALRGRRVLRQ